MNNYILCCVSSEKLNQNFLTTVQDFLTQSGAFIERSEVLSEQGLKAIDIHLSFPHDIERMKFDLMEISNKFQVDLALIPHDGKRLETKLIVFDMDSTLIQHEVIDEMALVHGIGEKVKLITERAMNGELNFDEALRERVALLKGLKKQDMEKIVNNLIARADSVPFREPGEGKPNQVVVVVGQFVGGGVNMEIVPLHDFPPDDFDQYK